MSLVGSWNCNDGSGNSVGGTPSAGSIDPASPAGTISNATDNGLGEVRITCVGHGLSTGQTVRIDNVGGTTEANGTWFVTVIDPDNFDLDGTVFANAYTSGGDFVVPWSWSVEDPPIGGTSGSLFLTSQSHVDLPSLGTFGNATSFSVAAWVRRSSTATGRSAALALSNASGDFTCCLGTPSSDPTKFGVDVGNSYNFSQGASASGAYTLNTWYHIAAVCKSTSELDFYQDGVYQATLTYSGATLSAADNSNGWSIGSEQDRTALNDYAYPWDGEVAFAKVYDHELSPSEIADLAGVGASPPIVSLTASTTSISENGGVVAVIATLDQTASASVVVTLGASGAASSTSDYTLSTNTITIASGQTSASISATAIPDVVYEGNENFTITLASVSGASASASSTASTSTVTIVDDDFGNCYLTSSAVSVAEANASAALVAVISATESATVNVILSIGGEATSGSDYSFGSQTISITTGNTSASISFTTIQDALDENTETVTIDISSITGAGQYTASSTSGWIYTIADDDATPQLTISASTTSIVENGGVGYFYGFLNAPSGRTASATFSFQVSGGSTATLDADFTRSSPAAFSKSTITFPVGQTSASVSVTAIADTLFEADEVITAIIGDFVNCTVGVPFSASMTIVNQYLPPFVSVSAVSASLPESGSTTAIVATMDHTHSANVTVVLGFGGSASTSSDYSYSTNTIVILSGASTGSISITSLQDSVSEGPETIVVSLASVTNGTAASAASATTVSIVDDDSRGSGSSGLSGLSGLSAIH